MKRSKNRFYEVRANGKPIARFVYVKHALDYVQVIKLPEISYEIVEVERRFL